MNGCDSGERIIRAICNHCVPIATVVRHEESKRAQAHWHTLHTNLTVTDVISHILGFLGTNVSNKMYLQNEVLKIISIGDTAEVTFASDD